MVSVKVHHSTCLIYSKENTVMNRALWIVGGVALATVLDLAYMFWSRSQAGSTYGKSIWHGARFGSGKYSVMPKPMWKK